MSHGPGVEAAAAVGRLCPEALAAESGHAIKASRGSSGVRPLPGGGWQQWKLAWARLQIRIGHSGCKKCSPVYGARLPRLQRCGLAAAAGIRESAHHSAPARGHGLQ